MGKLSEYQRMVFESETHFKTSSHTAHTEGDKQSSRDERTPRTDERRDRERVLKLRKSS